MTKLGPSVLHPPHIFVATVLGRLSQYMVGQPATTWHLLVADDFHLEAGGRMLSTGTLCFLLAVLRCGSTALVREDRRWRCGGLGRI